MEKIRFGIIGAGMIGPFHAEAICGLDDAELIGVATTREQTAKPFADLYVVGDAAQPARTGPGFDKCKI